LKDYERGREKEKEKEGEAKESGRNGLLSIRPNEQTFVVFNQSND